LKNRRDKIVDFLQKQECFYAEEKEIIEYGIEQGKNFILSIILVFLLGILFKTPVSSVVFLVMFIPLRKYAGGYHANSRLGCVLVSIASISCCFWLITKMKWSSYYLLLAVVSILIIFFIAPVQNSKKILEEFERKIYKRKTRMILVIEGIILVISFAFKLKDIFWAIMFALMLVETSLLVARILYLIQANSKKETIT